MAKKIEKKSIAASLTDAQRKGIKAIKAGRKPNLGQLSSLRRAKLVKQDGELSVAGKKAAASIARSEASSKPKKKAAKKSTGRKKAAKKSTGRKKAAKKSTGRKKAAKKSTGRKITPQRIHECAVDMGHWSRKSFGGGYEVVYE
jgi:hypothetical protein